MVTLNAVEQKDGHIDDVKIGQQVLGTAGHAHGQGYQQVTDIVEVARETPVTGAQQQGLMGLSIRCNEGGADDFGGLAPDHTLAVGGANNVLLVVDGAEDEVSNVSDSKDKGKLDRSQVDGVANEVVRLEGVQPGQPNGITPGQVEAKVVVGNVDGAQVPILVVEKVEDVGGVEQVQEDHRVGDIANLLILSSGEGQINHGPCDDSRTTVVEKLKVKELANTRVEFNTHQEIVDERTRELAVGRVGGEGVGLDEAEEGQEVSVHVGSDQETAPVVVDNRELPPAKVKATSSVDRMRDEPRQQTVHL